MDGVRLRIALGPLAMSLLVLIPRQLVRHCLLQWKGVYSNEAFFSRFQPYRCAGLERFGCAIDVGPAGR